MHRHWWVSSLSRVNSLSSAENNSSALLAQTAEPADSPTDKSCCSMSLSPRQPLGYSILMELTFRAIQFVYTTSSCPLFPPPRIAVTTLMLDLLDQAHGKILTPKGSLIRCFPYRGLISPLVRANPSKLLGITLPSVHHCFVDLLVRFKYPHTHYYS
jgi:hypothetical protein